MSHIGHIASIVYFPVKSMAGVVIRRSTLTEFGLACDRQYAFESSGAPPGMLRLTGRERREMLRYEPIILADGSVQIRTPTGESFPVSSNDLLDYFQQHIPDVSFLSLTRADTPQTDVRPLSLISLQTVHQLSHELGETLDLRRFRANLHLDLPAGPFTEDTLVGRTVLVGTTARIKILERDPRCRLITYDPDAPHSAPPLFSVMKLLDRFHEGRAGVYASILHPGAIEIGDPIQILA